MILGIVQAGRENFAEEFSPLPCSLQVSRVRENMPKFPESV
jgi:hypothetical protein